MYRTVTRCRVCKSSELEKYLDLGNTPLVNKLPMSSSERIERYPLEVLFCKECALSQLSIVVSPEVLYASNYPYYSSVSKTFREHCHQMALDLEAMLPMIQHPYGNKFPTVSDIASNDGCLLEEFRKEGFVVSGFEPCKELAAVSTSKLIGTVNDFFTEECAKNYSSSRHFVTATNVFAHVDDVQDFLRGIPYLLDKSGVLVIEVPYLVDMIQKNEFDTIYHEHLSYFLLKPLVRLFRDAGIPIFKVDKLSIHGGSIRIYASQTPYEKHESVDRMLNDESAYHHISAYYDFRRQVRIVVDNLDELLESLHKQGKRVLGYGASAKGVNLMNYCKLTTNDVQAIVDETLTKQGHYIPGCNIPIVSFAEFGNKPDYIVLFAWNFAAELMEKTKHLGAKYIIPIPNVEIV